MMIGRLDGGVPSMQLSEVITCRASYAIVWLDSLIKRLSWHFGLDTTYGRSIILEITIVLPNR